MVKRRYVLFLIVVLCSLHNSFLYSQEADVIPQTIITQPQPLTPASDTVVTEIELNESDLQKIKGIREQFELLNKLYSAPYQPNEKLLRFLKKDELEMSHEALYWLNKVYETPYYLSWRDIEANPLYLPLIFKGDYIKDTVLYDFPWQTTKTAYSDLFQPDTTLFQDVLKNKRFQEDIYRYMEKNHPDQFRYATSQLPHDVPKPHEIRTNPFAELFQVESETNFNEVEAPEKYRPKVRYWRPYFESALQFSQSYISENWYKGGNGNLNLFMRNYIKYDYNKDKVQLTNELEWKASFYTAPKDTLHEYRVGDDVFRIHSNLGYKAFNKWFYTFDAEFRTQLFTNYRENTDQKLAAFFSPFSINLGLGMKYELKKKFKYPGRNLSFTTNLAPLSYTYMYSVNDKIDLARHGFVDGKHYLSRVGSTIRADLTYNYNHFISWQSRLYYFTSYDRIEAEFENTLNLAISRYFSTRLYLNLRFDDGVKKKDPQDNYLQVYELISFGFNYKW